MNKHAVSVGVLGATGYAGRELVRLLAGHPGTELVWATSEGEAGRSLRSVTAAAPPLSLVRAEEADLDAAAVVFSCLPHGASLPWVERARERGARVVDLSSDLRVPAPAAGEADGAAPRAHATGPAGTAPLASSGRGAAVYGLPELFREEIRGAELVANPGCYPTAALLALAPLARRGLLAGAPVINAASGVTGAGRSPKRELLFAEVAEEYRAYALGNTHRHLAEMRHHLARVAGGPAEPVFTPHLLPVRRGILETIYVPLTTPLEAGSARELWVEEYEDEPFVEVLAEGAPSLGDAVGTNRVAIGIAAVEHVSSPALLVVAAIDNLIKGAAGQAVQNMNLMLGRAETEGLAC